MRFFQQLSETVAASAGSACHAGGTAMSGVLQAMGVDKSTGFGTLRLSVGRYHTAIDGAIRWKQKAVGRAATRNCLLDLSLSLSLSLGRNTRCYGRKHVRIYTWYHIYAHENRGLHCSSCEKTGWRVLRLVAYFKSTHTLQHARD